MTSHADELLEGFFPFTEKETTHVSVSPRECLSEGGHRALARGAAVFGEGFCSNDYCFEQYH